MLPYRISDRAENDIAAMQRWYDGQGPGLSDKAFAAVAKAINSARVMPQRFPVRHGARSVLCKRFPYRVYFEWINNEIIVAAVYHTRRSPESWNDPNRE